MTFYDRAQELKEETIAHRRYFHRNAEAGLDLPLAKAYVKQVLTDCGLKPRNCGYGVTASASEDFATVAENVPGCFMHLSAGFPDERGKWPAHNPKVLFNEDVLPTGAAAYAHCAAKWLETHQA